MSNRLSRYAAKINRAPQFLRSWLLTKLFCSQVKFANTANIRLLQLNNTEALLTLANKKAVQNHIGGIHAVAAALLAESATGVLLGMNVPDRRLPLLKSMTLSYHRRMQGDLYAKATLTPAQILLITGQDKGEIIVPVTITDDSGQEPIICQMLWAWISKKPNQAEKPANCVASDHH